MYTGSLKKINDISRDLFGKECYTLTTDEMSEVMDIFTEERAQGSYIQNGFTHKA
tara:strand:+ start:101 stop:265 length:165 start_codon:yes stop_codon:yes gene_type:complete